MTGSGFEIEEISGVEIVRCRPLASVPGLAHAFSTRRGGEAGDFDLGRAEDRREEIRSRRSRFLRAAGMEGGTAAVVRQVHGCRVIRAGEAGADVEADGVVWIPGDPPGLAPSVRTADCVPVLIAERDGRAFAAVHAGWRGTLGGIVPRAVETLASAGFPPERLVAAMGPAILRCCYEVGPEVTALAARARLAAAVVPAARAGLPASLDLHGALRAQLEAAGVSPGSIHSAPLCVRCLGGRFFSHRREGAAAGRMMASIGFARRTGAPGGVRT